MISLSKSGSTITFTFDENSGYLQNGTIDVPVNSLSLVIDSSDMVTFKKSASNDIFVSALASDFGMTKAELEAWYKENMVGSTGGGTDSGTVQSMIDQSISGKVDTSAVVTSITSGSTDYVIPTAKATYNALNGDMVRVKTSVTETALVFDNDEYTTNFPSDCSNVKITVTDSNKWGIITFYGTNDTEMLNFTYWDGVLTVDVPSTWTFIISGDTATITCPTSFGLNKLERSGNDKEYLAATAITYAYASLNDVIADIYSKLPNP